MENEPFHADRGVTPVVGIILLVAIAVILASVVAVFALGIDQTGTTPTAKFSFEYDESASNLTITHDTGQIIEAANVYVRGSDGSSGGAVDASWLGEGGGTSASLGGASAIASGDRLVISVERAYDLDVVWQSADGETSAILGEDQGPDA